MQTTKTRPQSLDPAIDTPALAERVQRLRTLLPAFAQETAVARREAARLRAENANPRCQVAELGTRAAAAART